MIGLVFWALGLSLPWASIQATITNPLNFEVRIDIPADSYTSVVADYSSNGYQLNWVSGHAYNDSALYFSCIFEKKLSSGPPEQWAGRLDYSASDLYAVITAYDTINVHPALLNGYTFRGVDYYVIIWKSGKVLMTGDVFSARVEEYKREGYLLKHVSGYAVGDEPRFAALWERNTTVVPEPVIRYGFTRSERLTKGMRDVRTHRSILLSGYTVGGIDYFIALWERRLEPDPAPPLPNTFGLLDLSRDRLERLKEQLMYQRVIPRSLSGYNAAGHFAATWESLFYSAEDAVNIDNHVGQFTNWGTRIPALSVAITKDERLVYASGFGLASRWDAIPQIMVSPRTRFRIASVSKIITATAIMTLVEAGRIHLSDHVFGPGSLTGDRYATYVPHRPNVDPNILEHQYEYSAGIEDITVQHLLEHTSGWDDISNPIIIINVDRWDSIRIIEDTVANVPLAHPPGTHFDYSNFGFLVLGQLIADLTNTEYETYVRTAVLDPAGVSPRFQLASNDGQLPDEVTYYPLDLTNANRWHEYGAFGGWVGTPIDLMRFSVHVDGMPGRKDVLNATTEGAMWAPSQVEPTQSLGWWGDEEEKFRGHDGELPDARSWLIQKTDGSGYGFAVCINVGTAKEWTVDKPDWWKVGATELREMVEGLIKLVKWPEYDLI